MRALFANLSEHNRQRQRDVRAYKVRERRRVLALCDAIQIAVAKDQRDRASVLLEEMHAIVDAALARRRDGAISVTAQPQLNGVSHDYDA